jgi:predicted phosphodiesterase
MGPVSRLLAERTTLRLFCLDRLLVQGYVPRLQSEGLVVRWMLDRGDAPSPRALGRAHDRMVDAVGRFVRQAEVPFVSPLPATDETLVLHVSDIHSNPVGLELVEKLAESLRVDAVLDTGDLTSFSFSVEAELTPLIRGLDVPYLLVPGNHDSPAVRKQLSHSGLRVLDGDVVQVGGVRILGVGDPTFTSDSRTTTEEARRVRAGDAGKVADLLRRSDPDVLAVHHAVLAGDAGGSMPLVVSGHVHERSRELRNGTLFLTVGSSAATGLGSLLVGADLGYEFEVLRFVGGRLSAIDYVTLRGADGDFVVERSIERRPPAVAGRTDALCAPTISAGGDVAWLAVAPDECEGHDCDEGAGSSGGQQEGNGEPVAETVGALRPTISPDRTGSRPLGRS